EPGGGRDRGRCYVTWVDMRYDGPDLAPPEPADERVRCLGGVLGPERQQDQPSGQDFFARLGATRGGSSGCFGYTGGHGASSSPLARSRAFISSSGSIDCGSSLMPSHGSPALSSRSA